MSDLAWAEYAARMFEPQTPRWETPGDLAKYLDPTTVQTPALDIVDEHLVRAFNTRSARLIITLPPQEGKSERATRRFPLWALTQNPRLRIAIASYSHDIARRFGRTIRDDVETHGQELGMTIRPDVSSQSEWELADTGGSVYSVGVGGSLTSRRVDLMIIDDPLKGMEQADSETYRENLWDWFTATVATRLSPGAPIIVIQTRWHEDDLAGKLLALDDDRWEVLSIPAQCEDPETDPLGRRLGEFMVSAQGRTQEDWELRKAEQTARSWAALFQQRPVPAEGAVWKAPWIDLNKAHTGDVLHRLARVVVAVDPAAKSKKTSDLTGIIVAGLDTQGHAWVLDDRTLRGTPIEWGMAAWDALLDWRGGELIVEDNQGGEMVQEVMRTAWHTVKGRRAVTQLAPPVRTVTATQSKRTRAESVAAYYEAGRVHHAADGTDRLHQLEQQMLSWTGDGTSPDRIDALVHALTVLFAPNHSGAAIRPRRRDYMR